MAGENLQVSGIKLDTSDLRRGSSRAEREFKKLERRANRLEREVRDTSDTFGNLGKAAAAAVAAIGGFEVMRRTSRFIFQTNREFEQLEARLVSVTGSVSDAEQAFDTITDFASTTPFQIQNLVQAFTRLQVSGIQPTSEMLEGLGNFAAAFGKDITDAVEAILRAAQGGTERLRESFGIPIEKEGNRIRITFRGVTREVEASSEAMLAHFTELGRAEFGDAMRRQVNTLEGSISNLQDAAAIAARKVGEEGLNEAVTNLVHTLREAIEANDEFAKQLGRNLAAGVRVSTRALEVFVNHIDEIVTAVQVLMGLGAARGLVGLVRLLPKLATAAASAGTALRFAFGGPVAAVVGGLAALIGGPLVANLLSARSEAEKFANAIQRGSEGLQSTEDPEAISSRLEELRRLRDEIFQRGQRRRRQAGQTSGGLSSHFRTLAEKDREKVQELNKEINRLQNLLNRLTSSEEEATQATTEHSDAVDKILEGLRAELREVKFSERELLRRKLALEGATDAEIQQALAIHDQTQALKEQAEAEEDARRAAERRRKELERQQERVREANRRIREQARQASRDFASNLQLAQIQEEMRRIEEFSERMGEAFTEMAEEVFFQSENVVDAVRGMVDQILREIARLVLAQTVGKFLGGLVTSALGGGIPAAPGPVDVQPPDLSGMASFQRGGAFTVGGTGGTDSELVAFRATPGERVSVMPERGGGGGGGSGGQVVVHNENNFAPSMIDAESGRQFLEKHKGDIARIMVDAASNDAVRQALLGGHGA